ncbi:ankyrin repeat domain-containing protein [Bacteroidota bacterium]
MKKLSITLFVLLLAIISGRSQNIFEAIEQNDYNLVEKKILEDKSLINSRAGNSYTPLHYAANKNRPEILELLIKNGADIHAKTSRGRTPLFLVAMNNGNVSITKQLILAGANVNTQENSGGTPITYSVFRNFKEMTDILIDNGAIIRVDTELWHEVFHRACSFNLKRLAEIMINKGLDIYKRNEDGKIALHSAVEGGSVELVELLINKGNDVQSIDYCGITPLHLAALSGHYNIVKKLIDLGAEINIKNLMGETALNLARKNQHQSVAELLIGEGAKDEPAVFPVLKADYLGQEKTSKEVEVFAPGLVSSYSPVHGSVVFSASGNLALWSIVDFKKRGSSVLCMERINNIWSPPKEAFFSSGYSDDVPFFHPGKDIIYFLSNRPVIEGGTSGKENIWYIKKIAEEWTDPVIISPKINSMDLHWQFSVAENGNIYFASSSSGGKGLNDIFFSEFSDGEYSLPVNLGESINSQYADFAPLISPDEDFLIFTSIDRPDSNGGTDLYISFKEESGAWSKSVNMGSEINSDGGELLTTISPDGKYLFFTGRRFNRKGVFWVDSGIIDSLKNIVIND